MSYSEASNVAQPWAVCQFQYGSSCVPRIKKHFLATMKLGNVVFYLSKSLHFAVQAEWKDNAVRAKNESLSGTFFLIRTVEWGKSCVAFSQQLESFGNSVNPTPNHFDLLCRIWCNTNFVCKNYNFSQIGDPVVGAQRGAGSVPRPGLLFPGPAETRGIMKVTVPAAEKFVWNEWLVSGVPLAKSAIQVSTIVGAFSRDCRVKGTITSGSLSFLVKVVGRWHRGSLGHCCSWFFSYSEDRMDDSFLGLSDQHSPLKNPDKNTWKPCLKE